MMFLASIVTHAQTSYGGLAGNEAGLSGGVQSSFFGTDAGLNATENTSTFIGYQAGMNSNDGTGLNTFVGHTAGANSNRFKNTYIGGAAGTNNTSGFENTFVGAGAGHVGRLVERAGSDCRWWRCGRAGADVARE